MGNKEYQRPPYDVVLNMLIATETDAWYSSLVSAVAASDTGARIDDIVQYMVPILANARGCPTSNINLRPQDVVGDVEHLTAAGVFNSQDGESYNLSPYANTLFTARKNRRERESRHKFL